MTKLIKKTLASLFLILYFAFLITSEAHAGTDLTVTCLDQGLCDIAPASTPLFYETNMLPGDSSTQYLTITNQDVDDTCNLVLFVTDASDLEAEDINLAERIFAAITDGSTAYFGSQTGGEANPGVTYQDLYDNGNINLGTLFPSSTRTFEWYAKFDFDAGNKYQNTQSVFDFDISIACAGGAEPTPTPTPTSNPDPGPAYPPTCDATKPSGIPVLTVTSNGANSVNLTWTAVSPVTHYALVFTRDDGEQYGSNNIGNGSSYTVNNLSGGRSYTFEIFGVNGCAPGDRSISVATGSISGLPVTGRPTGQGGEVLGETSDETATPEPTPESGPKPEVLGESTCSIWKWYLPWMLLIAQGLLILAIDYYLRKDEKLTKYYIAAGLTLASIVIFYLVRECNCYGDVWWFFVWLCKWYFIVSILLTLILKAANYAFIEETQVKDPSTSSGSTRDDEDKKTS